MIKKILKTRLLILALYFLSIDSSFAQTSSVTLSGMVKDQSDKSALPFVNVVLKAEKDSTFVSGVITDDEGRFTLSDIKPGHYILEISYVGYETKRQSLFVGNLSEFLDVSVIELTEDVTTLSEVVVAGKFDDVSNKMDKKHTGLRTMLAKAAAPFCNPCKACPV